MSYSSGTKSKENVPSGFIWISWITFLGSSRSSSFLVSLELYTTIVADCLLKSLAWVITLPEIADNLWIFTVYSFLSPLKEVTITFTSFMV